MTISRRDFVKRATISAGSVGGLAATSLASNAKLIPKSHPSLDVLLFLEGGLDPLSVLIPLTGGPYQHKRPNIAVRRGIALPLNGSWGLDPALNYLHDLWANDELHFLLTDCDVERSHTQGGAGLAADYIHSLVRPSASAGDSIARPTIIANPDSLTSRWPASRRLRRRQITSDGGNGPPDVTRLAQAMQASLSSQFVLAIDGFDTHNCASRRNPGLLKSLNTWFKAVKQALMVSGQASQSAILVCSELGRSLMENSQYGTDHGSLFLAIRTVHCQARIDVSKACSDQLL